MSQKLYQIYYQMRGTRFDVCIFSHSKFRSIGYMNNRIELSHKLFIEFSVFIYLKKKKKQPSGHLFTSIFVRCKVAWINNNSSTQYQSKIIHFAATRTCFAYACLHFALHIRVHFMFTTCVCLLLLLRTAEKTELRSRNLQRFGLFSVR